MFRHSTAPVTANAKTIFRSFESGIDTEEIKQRHNLKEGELEELYQEYILAYPSTRPALSTAIFKRRQAGATKEQVMTEFNLSKKFTNILYQQYLNTHPRAAHHMLLETAFPSTPPELMTDDEKNFDACFRKGIAEEENPSPFRKRAWQRVRQKIMFLFG